MLIIYFPSKQKFIELYLSLFMKERWLETRLQLHRLSISQEHLLINAINIFRESFHLNRVHSPPSPQSSTILCLPNRPDILTGNAPICHSFSFPAFFYFFSLLAWFSSSSELPKFVSFFSQNKNYSFLYWKLFCCINFIAFVLWIATFRDVIPSNWSALFTNPSKRRKMKNCAHAILSCIKSEPSEYANWDNLSISELKAILSPNFCLRFINWE